MTRAPTRGGDGAGDPQAAMALDPEPKYPNRRAYVVKVRSDAKPDALVGRVENLVTGASREFATGEELLDSLASDLASGNAKDTKP